jgi:hypothetical protein
MMQRASPALDKRCKGGLDFEVAADIEHNELFAHRLRSGGQRKSVAV